MGDNPSAAGPARRIALLAADGHLLGGFRADPAGPAKGCVVVLHAVYGLTPAIASVVARWAKHGYAAIAPALFDRICRDQVFAYRPEGVSAGVGYYKALSKDRILCDVAACVNAFGSGAPAVISGFCTGGTWAWVAAAAGSSFAAQVNFYGSHIPQPEFFELEPQCPTLVHYGDSDHVVPLDDVERIKARHPRVEVMVHRGAGHAFLNPDQETYHADSAEAAWRASFAFLDRVIAGRAKAG